MLEIWTVYKYPIDMLGHFVARKWWMDQPTGEFFHDATLEALRDKLPKGLIRMERSPQDDPVIVETWI